MNPLEDLSNFLQKLNGPLTRNAVQIKRKEIRSKLKRAEPTQAPIIAELQPTETGVQCNLAGEEPIQALLLELSSKTSIAGLKKDYTDGDPAFARVGQRVADDAALVALTKLSVLPLLYTKLHCWGFSKFASIYFVSAPAGPHVTDEKVIATCRRGGVKLPTLVNWPSETDSVRLAEHFVGDIRGRKIHLFADEPRPGWESLVGEANWIVG